MCGNDRLICGDVLRSERFFDCSLRKGYARLLQSHLEVCGDYNHRSSAICILPVYAGTLHHLFSLLWTLCSEKVCFVCVSSNSRICEVTSVNLWIYIKEKSRATYLKLCCSQECTLSCCLSLGQPELSNMTKHVKNIYAKLGMRGRRSCWVSSGDYGWRSTFSLTISVEAFDRVLLLTVVFCGFGNTSTSFVSLLLWMNTSCMVGQHSVWWAC